MAARYLLNLSMRAAIKISCLAEDRIWYEAADLRRKAINGAINDDGVCLQTLAEWWILQPLLHGASSSIFYFYDISDYLISADSLLYWP